MTSSYTKNADEWHQPLREDHRSRKKKSSIAMVSTKKGPSIGREGSNSTNGLKKLYLKKGDEGRGGISNIKKNRGMKKRNVRLRDSCKDEEV